MTPEMQKCLTEMAEAVRNLNRTLESEIGHMQKSGLPAPKIERVRAGAKAIKDCGNMLLVWTDYIARGDLDDPTEGPDARYDPHPR